jgi:predicted nuclease of predicted toxin-antitoxin system
MKFIVDAQLPDGLARFLQASGYDRLHTKDSGLFHSPLARLRMNSPLL